MVFDLGVGLAEAGLSVAGYGTPATLISSIVPLFVLPDGTQGNVAAINPQTGDYIIDDNANFIGQQSVPQMVYLALTTKFNSSAVVGFGLDISSIKTISSNVANLFQSRVQSALQNMITAQLIRLINVKVTTSLENGVTVVVNYQDLTSGEINKFLLIG